MKTALPRTISVVLALSMFGARSAVAQPPSPDQGDDQTPPAVSVTVDVVGTAPLPGVERRPDEIPAPVQTATGQDLQARGATDLSDLLNRQFSGVHVNEIQGNPFQTDVNFRGYTASPLLGTPQGLSVYMDGVRMNQPFGEVVSWDLIPRFAIGSSTLIPGSNPLFGLNALGGALLVQTKSGRTSAGTAVQATYGSDARRAVEVEHGGANGRLDWYLAGNLFAEDGWRNDSPSDVRQAFGKIGWREAQSDVSLTLAYADNSLIGNGLQEQRQLDLDYAGIYTKPDITDNRSTLVNVAARRSASDRVSMAGNVYYRHIRTGTVNGDVNDDVLEEEDGRLDLVFLYPGLLNTTASLQHNYGGSGQVTLLAPLRGQRNALTIGAGFDGSRVQFEQAGEFGFLAADRAVFGSGVQDDEAAVALTGRIHTWSLYATDTLSIDERWHLTVSGRFNRTIVHNRDGLEPGGGPGSLDGDHMFSRFNPAAGLTFTPSRQPFNLYAGYGEGSRAPAAVELGCADPEAPCRLPNAMAGDPPLEQVVARTWEGGVRALPGGRLQWNAGAFRAVNDDDILFVSSGLTGFGYFRNFGRTRRQGIELGLDAPVGRATIGAAYTLLDATYQTTERVDGGSNSTRAPEDDPDEGTIGITPGDRLPLVPRHLVKVYADVAVTDRLMLDADAVGVSASYARGNENNQHEPDGVEFVGAGTAPGYVVVNAGARYGVTRWLQAIVQVNNVFDRRYASAAQLGPTAFTPEGRFAPQPVVHGTFVAPGAPRLFWVGTRVTF